MELKKRQERGDDYPERKSLEADKVSKPTTNGYIPYLKAIKILREKWAVTPEEPAVTPEELAIWIFLGPETGGIAAYQDAKELNPPPRFYFDHFMGEDYQSELMKCYFRQDDIDQFVPEDRYIDGTALIELWGNQPDLCPEAFILAKIVESRLTDFHPTFGGTRGTRSDDTSYPPLSAGLFAMSEIKQIEAEDGLDSFPVLSNSGAPVQDRAGKKGGQRPGPLNEAVRKAYCHFHAAGNTEILKPRKIRSFMESFNSLLNDNGQSKEFGNGNVRAYIAERIKEVKIPRHGICYVTPHDRTEGIKVRPGKPLNQNSVAKLLTALRKEFPINS